MKDNKILVIVVTYNAMKWADRCFSSLISSSIPLDIYVVDNGSTDGTQDFINTRFPNITINQSERNLGFGRANNLGLQYALDNGYNYVYLLNQDAWLFPDTIEKLIDVSKKYPEFEILSPFQINSNGRIDKYFLINVCSWKSNPDLLNDLYNKQVNDVYSVTNVMAAHWFLPISTIKKIGGFSPSFPHYGEDDNYIDRSLFKGGKVGIVPSLRVVHDRSSRVDTIDKNIYIGYIDSIKLLSDPSIKTFYALLQALHISLTNSLAYKSIKPIIKYCSLLFQIREIINNKRESVVKERAFLE